MKEEEEKMVKKMEKGETIKTRYGKGYSWNFPENSKPTLWKTIEEKLRVKKLKEKVIKKITEGDEIIDDELKSILSAFPKSTISKFLQNIKKIFSQN